MVDLNGSGLLASSHAQCLKGGNEFKPALARPHKQLGITQLDEKQLEVGVPEVPVLNTSFVVSDGLGGPAPPNAMDGSTTPLGISGPVLLVGPGSPYNPGNIFTIDNSQGNTAFVTLCQQPAYHYQQPAAQPIVVEQEIALAHKCLQECPRGVLVSVFSSLLEELPHLCPVVRQRCEKAAMLAPKQHPPQHIPHQQPQGLAGRFTGLSQNSAPWAAHLQTSAYDNPRPTLTPAAGNSPQTGGSRKGRGNKSREEGLCSLHNNVRSMNHLQLNKQKGVYECVSGFHCLEDGGSGSASPASPKVPRTTVAPSGGAQLRNDVRGISSFAAVPGTNFAPGSKVSPPPGFNPNRKDQFGEFLANSLDSGLTPFRGDVSLGNSGIIPFDDHDALDGSEAVDLDTSMVTLKSILQSVRMVAEMEN